MQLERHPDNAKVIEEGEIATGIKNEPVMPSEYSHSSETGLKTLFKQPSFLLFENQCNINQSEKQGDVGRVEPVLIAAVFVLDVAVVALLGAIVVRLSVTAKLKHAVIAT